MSEMNEMGRRYRSFPRPRRRTPVIDMLPYAGVAFILLSAFTLASQMSRPHVMEIIDPCQLDGCWEILDIQIHIRHDDSLFLSTSYDPRFHAVSPGTIRGIVGEKILRRNDRFLVTIVVDPAASYGRMADVLDRLNLAEAETSEIVRARDGRRVRRLRILPMSYDNQLEVENL